MSRRKRDKKKKINSLAFDQDQNHADDLTWPENIKFIDPRLASFPLLDEFDGGQIGKVA